MIDSADEHRQMTSALAGAFERFDGLVRLVQNPSELVRDSTWTVGDLIAHVSGGLESYARYLDGQAAAAFDVSDMAGGSLVASNADHLRRESERTIGVLRDRARVAFDEVIARANELELDERVPWHGREEPLRCVLAAALGELLMHGHDLARTVGAPWRIEQRDAALLVDNIAPLLPLLVNVESTRNLVADIRIIVRGGETIHLSFDHGTLTVGGDPERFDATVNANPVSFLLVAYGRRSQWREIARGGLVAWGRRPWLALKLTSYLVPP